jgi:hypothetical protein
MTYWAAVYDDLACLFALVVDLFNQHSLQLEVAIDSGHNASLLSSCVCL